ncbi:MAG: hypothetical protein AAF601_04265 [Pseudomonadota bacterium]
MKPIVLVLVAATVLSACGQARVAATNTFRPQAQFATGPIYAACRKAAREAATRARCGCVQAVANRELNASDQNRGARFFSDPQDAQDVRQSDRNVDERFWLRWRAYSDVADQMCTG